MATSGTSSRILWWISRLMIRIFGHGLLSLRRELDYLKSVGMRYSRYDEWCLNFVAETTFKKALRSYFLRNVQPSFCFLTGIAAAYRQPDADDFDVGTARLEL